MAAALHGQPGAAAQGGNGRGKVRMEPLRQRGILGRKIAGAVRKMVQPTIARYGEPVEQGQLTAGRVDDGRRSRRRRHSLRAHRADRLPRNGGGEHERAIQQGMQRIHVQHDRDVQAQRGQATINRGFGGEGGARFRMDAQVVDAGRTRNAIHDGRDAGGHACDLQVPGIGQNGAHDGGDEREIFVGLHGTYYA